MLIRPRTMNAFIVASNLRLLVFFTTVVYFTRADHASDMDDELPLEEQYRKLHPDLDNVTWPLIDRLTVEIHKNMCNQVLSQTAEPGEDLSKRVYKMPEEATVRRSRVIRQAPLYFQGSPVHYVPIIVCTYEDFKMYLAHGDDKHVFTLERDQGNIFYLNSGLHAVNIDT